LYNFDIADPIDGYYFGHMLSKICQYATFNEKVACGLPYASIKSAQVDVEKVHHMAEEI